MTPKASSWGWRRDTQAFFDKHVHLPPLPAYHWPGGTPGHAVRQGICSGTNFDLSSQQPERFQILGLSLVHCSPRVDLGQPSRICLFPAGAPRTPRLEEVNREHFPSVVTTAAITTTYRLSEAFHAPSVPILTVKMPELDTTSVLWASL